MNGLRMSGSLVVNVLLVAVNDSASLLDVPSKTEAGQLLVTVQTSCIRDGASLAYTRSSKPSWASAPLVGNVPGAESSLGVSARL